MRISNVVDASIASKYNLFILQVLKTGIDQSRKDPRTIHHRGKGEFMFAGQNDQAAVKGEIVRCSGRVQSRQRG